VRPRRLGDNAASCATGIPPLTTIRSLLLLGCALLYGCGARHPGAHHAAFAWTRAAAPHLPARVAPDVTVRSVQFGVLETDRDGAEHFVATNEVPAEEGRVFGWVVAVETTRDTLHWQEHLQLPRPPADWGEVANDPDVLISPDGKSVVAEGDDEVEDGELSRFYWTLAPGDPQGEYQLDVAVEGRPVAHFAFRVPSPVQEKAILVRADEPRAAGGFGWR
jgi:hypothetical protein